jgi:cytochrome c peroxidase
MKRLFFSIAFTALSFNAFAVSLTAEQQLGEALYKDKNLSINGNQSCERMLMGLFLVLLTFKI